MRIISSRARRRRVKFFAQLSRKKAGRGAGARWAPSSAWSPLPLGNVPPGRSGPRRGSQVCALPKACAKPSLASPLGGGGLALARTERASCQRPPPMGCVEALAGCPLSRLTATAPPKGEPSLASPFGGRWCPVGTVQRLVSAAASVGDGRSPLGCITRGGSRDAGTAAAVTERAARQRFHTAHVQGPLAPCPFR